MRSKDTPTRRQFLGSTLGLLGAATGIGVARGSLFAGRSVDALSATVTGPATVIEPAERLGFTGKLTFPVDTAAHYGSLVCLNNFGGRSATHGSCHHAGVDIGNDAVSGRGRPLLACADGVVEKDEFIASAGKTRILHDGLGAYYRYHHLDSYESTLVEGDRVVAGQVIGYMGATGYSTQWNHLHFEIWYGSLTPRLATIVDPVPLLMFPSANVTLRAATACSD